MHPDMFLLAERLVVAIERMSQDVNNISAYMYDLSYNVSHFFNEKREKEDISLETREEGDSSPSDTPARGCEASAESQYSWQSGQARGNLVSRIDDVEREKTSVADVESMSIDRNETCDIFSSFSGDIKTEKESESEDDDVLYVENTYDEGRRNVRISEEIQSQTQPKNRGENQPYDRHTKVSSPHVLLSDIAVVVKDEINFTEDSCTLSEKRSIHFPSETLEDKDCTAHAYRQESENSVAIKLESAFNTGSALCDKTSTSTSNLVCQSGNRSIYEGSFKASSYQERLMHRHRGEPPFVCVSCGKEFMQMSHLTTHMHSHMGDKPYRCAECGKAFMHGCHLSRHMLLHSNVKRFKCTVCGKAFSRSDKFTNHMRVHSGEKPYTCTECGSAFSRSDKLANHMRIHTNEKPYQCTLCGRAVSQRCNLKIHMGVHAGECRFACEDCGSRFNTSTSLRWHRLLEHGVPAAVPEGR